MIYRLFSWIGVKLITAVEYQLRHQTRSAEPVPPWAFALAEKSGIIRQEFTQLFDVRLREFGKISREQQRITVGNSWKVFILKAYGRNLQGNMALCPETTALCAKIPEITTILFSVLEAGTHITPHRGPYAGVLRCHIPLVIPEGDCGLRVADTTLRWQPGQPLIFDDTLVHEAWNRTSQRRVVLFIDYLRPLPLPLAWLNRAMVLLIGYSPFIGKMLRASL